MLWGGGVECSRGIAHWRCRGREGEGVQPWDRPLALQGERGGRSAAVGSPTSAAWGGRRGGLQPWDRPQALQERGEGGEQPWDRPLALSGEGGGQEGSRGTARWRCQGREV